MSSVGRAAAIAMVLCCSALPACGDDDADDAAAAATTLTTSTRERGLTVCGVEEEVDHVVPAPARAGDFAGQRESAIAYLGDIVAIRITGRPPTDIAADYASVTEAYEVVRTAFEASSTPDEYLTEVEAGALAAFGTRAEVDRFIAAYTAWVEEQCGFDPQLGIQLFAEED